MLDINQMARFSLYTSSNWDFQKTFVLSYFNRSYFCLSYTSQVCNFKMQLVHVWKSEYAIDLDLRK